MTGWGSNWSRVSPRSLFLRARRAARRGHLRSLSAALPRGRRAAARVWTRSMSGGSRDGRRPRRRTIPNVLEASLSAHQVDLLDVLSAARLRGRVPRRPRHRCSARVAWRSGGVCSRAVDSSLPRAHELALSTDRYRCSHGRRGARAGAARRVPARRAGRLMHELSLCSSIMGIVEADSAGRRCTSSSCGSAWRSRLSRGR